MRGPLTHWLILGLLLGTAVYAIAEEITLTTYYPSPRGVYQELKTAGDLVVGDITNPPGARLHVVQEGTAPALRVDDVASDPSPVLVDADGNVGIGTASPQAKLDVQGGAVRVPVLASAPSSPLEGMVYFDSAANRYRGYQNGQWIYFVFEPPFTIVSESWDGPYDLGGTGQTFLATNSCPVGFPLDGGCKRSIDNALYYFSTACQCYTEGVSCGTVTRKCYVP